MVVCELDSEISGEVLGWKLPAWQSLLLNRVLPSCGGLVVYLTVMCFDLTLIYEHYQDGHNGVAVFCIILMILPAIIAFVFTLASPPPGLQTEETAFSVTLQKNDVQWILIQILNLLVFPVAAIGRYCYEIFWWVEAVCAARSRDDGRTKDALSRIRAPSPLELYLFLQAFIHAAPHAIVNILNLMSPASSPTFDKVSIQAVSIIASTLRMASTATLYRRFEREKICGRKYPWNVNTQMIIDNATNEDIEKAGNTTEDNIYEPVLRNKSLNTNNALNMKLNSDMIQFSPSVTQRDDNLFFESDSETGSGYLLPVHQNNQPDAAEIESEDEYIRPKSIIERVAPRRSTQYTIEEVPVTPPPATPAPRHSLAVWAEKIVENAESIPVWLSAPPRRRHIDVVEETVKEEPELPRRVPRKFMRGLEPQDATAALVNFLGWHMFFVARLLSIAAFINFFSFAAIIVLFSHYQIVLLLLIVPQASSVRRGFYVFLAFIYLFCLMEFKIRFRHVRAWHVFWILVCTIETIVFTSVWAAVNNNLTGWWRQYVVLVILGSTLLSYMCMLVYFVILKPRETIVYFDEPKKSEM